MILIPRKSTLFPYTTLFRSRWWWPDGLVDPAEARVGDLVDLPAEDRKSTRLNSSHVETSYAVFCLKKITFFVNTNTAEELLKDLVETLVGNCLNVIDQADRD